MMVHDLTKDDDPVVDLAAKDKADLDARLEGVVAREQRGHSDKQKRINWDTPANAALRERIARSWIYKNDLYNKGECFKNFCIRSGISRTVLIRFLGRPQGPEQRGRGRPPFLTEDQMRHLCEGLLGA